MSSVKLGTPDDPASASSALSPLPRRRFLSHSATIAAAASLATAITGKAFGQAKASTRSKQRKEGPTVSTITTKDGVEIFYKDWGTGQPIVFSHGWPLSADDWDTQMSFFLNHGYRVIAHDRRGHGRSAQTGSGHDMDHYADDLAALTAHLDLKNAVHVGHSTGGGEVVHYLARHGQSRVAKADDQGRQGRVFARRGRAQDADVREPRQVVRRRGSAKGRSPLPEFCQSAEEAAVAAPVGRRRRCSVNPAELQYHVADAKRALVRKGMLSGDAVSVHVCAIG
jgi:pimeloyl-ACP methyl ester carboxylesterase